MRVALALLASLALVSASTHNHHHAHKHHHSTAPMTEKELEVAFTSFVKTHNKQYTHDDFFNRFTIFKENMEKIRVHNMSNKSYTLGVNEYADMTWSEFRATKKGYKARDQSLLRSLNAEKLDASAAPASIDWRNVKGKSYVTPVKNQGQCGGCWAFSTTGSVEGAVAQRTGKLISLSEQQLIDCSTAQGNQGCNGGLMDDAFQYIISNNGITSEAQYPYLATGPNTCNTDVTSVSTIKSYKDVPAGDEKSLLAAVALRPVSIAIEADQEAFQLYSGGVMTGTCGTTLDHGVLAVGYGVDAGTPYWIVKNSWGASWGEQGYIRLERGINQCGLANSASYPIA